MRLHFNQDDSIYKIFKTIRKIPSYRSVKIFIDPEHDFFATDWRGKEVLDTLAKKEITATFIVNDLQSKRYFEDLGAEVSFQQTNPFLKVAWQAYNLFFATKQFHNNLLVKQNYVSYLVLFAELAVICLVLYLFWGIISPNANVQVRPNYTVENIVYNYRYYPAEKNVAQAGQSFISVPYYTGSIPFEHEMTLNVENITYSTQEARGTVTIYNTLDEPLSLLNNTKLITEDGLLFETQNWVNIPPGTAGQPGSAVADVIALPQQENGVPIGEEGNIPADTTLYVRNLAASREDQAVYAVSNEQFVGGQTNAEGTVIAADIQRVRERVTRYMQEKRKEILQRNFNVEDGHTLLFNDLIQVNTTGFVSSSFAGESAAFVGGEIQGEITYMYILWDDLIEAVDTYIRQRPSENLTLVDLDKNSLTFFDYTYDEQGDFYLIPTKVNAIWSYNFEEDSNNLIGELRENIVGKSREAAKQVLLQYDQIAEVDISISPPWYDTLPKLKSRIKFSITH